MTAHESLERSVHDALTHLYDLPYLQEHSLARGLGDRSTSESPGRVLRRLILEAIQELKPPPGSPSESFAADRYQFLYLRYVKAHSVEQTARDLALSERQLYRRQREALEAVAQTVALKLASPLRTSRAGSTLQPGEVDLPESPVSEPPDRSAQDEIDRFGTARPPVPVDLGSVLRSCLTTIGNLTRGEARSVELDLPPDLPPVSADRAALRQALLGLLVYVCGLDGRIELRASFRASDGRLHLSVRVPTGQPGPECDADDSNLAIGRRLIELQGGTLEWERGDPGAALVVVLPVARRRLVLIVDDNADAVQLFRRYLEARACRVLVARTGEEALRTVGTDRPDAVILDVMLPAADGYEVLQTLRGDPETAAVPVIVCTVLKQRDLALSIGATDFLTKPVTQGTLLAALDRALGGADA